MDTAIRPASAPEVRERETARLDTVKGLLIFLVVFGHARVVHDHAGATVGFLYLWHVQSFFLLAALSARPLDLARARDLALRYLVPFVWIVTGLVLVAVLRGKDAGLAAVQWAKALWFGSSPYLGAATEASVYWFLPSFLCLSLLLAGLAGLEARKRIVAIVLVVAAGVARGIFDVPLGTLEWPLGSGLVFYLGTSALAFTFLWRSVAGHRAREGAALALATAALVYAALFWAQRPPLVNIALYRFPADPVNALATMALPVLVLTGIMVLAGSPYLQRLFAAIGRRSLLIYLFHQPILFPLWLVVRKIAPPPFAFASALVMGLVMTLVSIALASLIGTLLWRSARLKALLLPAGWAEWRSGWQRG